MSYLLLPVPGRLLGGIGSKGKLSILSPGVKGGIRDPYYKQPADLEVERMHGSSGHLIVAAEGIDKGHRRKNPSVGQQPVTLGLPGSSDHFIEGCVGPSPSTIRLPPIGGRG